MKELSTLPYRVIIYITKEFYLYRMRFQGDENFELVRSFFGKFIRDRTQKIFLIFGSFSLHGTFEDLEKYQSEIPLVKLLYLQFPINVKIRDDTLRKCREIRTLRGLRLVNKELSALESICSTLQTLEIHLEMPLCNKVLGCLNKCRKLERLAISTQGKSTIDGKVQLILPNLKRVQFSNEFAKHLRGMDNSKKLEFFRVVYSKVREHHIEELMRIRTLKVVVLFRSKLAVTFWKLFSLPRLRRIELNWSKMDVNNFKSVYFAEECPLKVIELEKVEDVPMLFFNRILKLKNLEMMNLQDCNVRDDLLELLLEKESRWSKNVKINIGNAEVSEELLGFMEKEKCHIQIIHYKAAPLFFL